MNNIICFFLGVFLGGFLGVIVTVLAVAGDREE